QSAARSRRSKPPAQHSLPPLKIAAGFEGEAEINGDEDEIDADQPVAADEETRHGASDENLRHGDDQPEYAAPRRREPESHSRDEIEHAEEDDGEGRLLRHGFEDRTLRRQGHEPIRKALKQPEDRDDAHEHGEQIAPSRRFGAARGLANSY